MNPIFPRRARVARPAPTFWIVLKTLFHTLTFWLAFFGVLPLVLCEFERKTPLRNCNFESRFWRFVGASGFVLAGILGVWSSLTMAIFGRGTMLPLDCAPRLVIRGPYRFIRNPMVLSGLAQMVFAGMFRGSPLTILVAILGFFARQKLIAPWEDADLSARFGAQWENYKAQTSEWWPR